MLRIFQRAAQCCALLASLWPACLAAEDHLLLPAGLNGRPARFALDTAAGVEFAIWRPAATRFALEIGSPPKADPAAGQVAPAWTNPIQVELLGQILPGVSFAVIDPPSTAVLDADGLIGWTALRRNILVFQLAEHRVQLASRLPVEAPGWLPLGVRADASTLILTLPSRDGRAPDSVLVDTGSRDGVRLSPEKWRQWQTAHPARASTMTAYFKPGAGLVVAEESWAETLTLGDIVLHDVPVTEADVTDSAAVGDGFSASLGLAALARLELVVDGPRRLAYVRPSRSAPPKYAHNRLGAVFVPRDAQSDDLVAWVSEATPAFAAGIRGGDVLLKVDQLDVTEFRRRPGILPLSRFWDQPAATKLNLELRRDAHVFHTTIELRDLLGAERLHETAQ